MTDFALDSLTRDLVLPLKLRDGAERVGQSVGIRLRAWLGEWFLDTGYGVPYLESVLVKNPRPEIVEAILRAQILSVQGVRRIQTFNLTIDNKTRKARVDFVIESDEGLATGVVTLGQSNELYTPGTAPYNPSTPVTGTPGTTTPPTGGGGTTNPPTGGGGTNPAPNNRLDEFILDYSTLA